MAGSQGDSPTSGDESFCFVESSPSSPHIGTDAAQSSIHQTTSDHALPNHYRSSSAPAGLPSVPANSPSVPASPPSVPANPPPVAGTVDPWKPFTLQVGEIISITSRHTLSKARFFRQRFQPGGTLSDSDYFFLDRDPDVFFHVLRFCEKACSQSFGAQVTVLMK